MQVIVRPLVTEKSMQDVTKGKYTFIVDFIVDRFATKPVIKQAVKDMFNVTVVSVATNIVKGRSKRVGTRRNEVPEAAYKKATVTLKKGEKISLFESGAEEGKK
jgi:large subunit ribosomal protein L23